MSLELLHFLNHTHREKNKREESKQLENENRQWAQGPN